MTLPQNHHMFLIELKKEVEEFADSGMVKALLDNNDMIEVLCRIEDYDILWRLDQLPEQYKDVRLFGITYFKRLNELTEVHNPYLIRTFSNRLDGILLQDSNVRDEFATASKQFLRLIESKIGPPDNDT